ncbi:MMPL family transporter [Bacillus sp. BHET2]|uniref:MMPL family transporter n=1 Tax=Bacillus sp. BHET2 TaxID=2583818 RepID=UPI00110D9F07|nr:MMPL family transporter [Bacillus sp. BHET2]TMU87320.1 MMPL family transporter [Bacillus sp. BHET2]
MNLIGKGITRFYKWVILFWVILAGVFGYFATDLASILGGDGFRTEGQFEKVNEELTNTFDFPESSILLLMEKQDAQSNVDFNTSIKETLGKVEKLSITSSIQSPIQDETLMKDKLAYAVLSFDQSDISVETKEIQELIKENPGQSLTGASIISSDINKASQDDLKRAELIGLPFALLVLLVAFGSAIASIVPVVIGMVTVVTSFGILTLIGEHMELSVFLLNVVPMIGLALSIDFSLLFINRYREELIKTSISEAIQTTIKTAGRSIIFSAVCVFIGLGAMMLIDIDIFQTIAIGGMVVVLLAVVSALSLLPSVLMLLGNSINKWMLIKQEENSGGKWKTYAGFIMKRPVVLALLAILVLMIGILPVRSMNLAIPDSEALPITFESRQAMDTIQEEFHTNEGSTVYVVAERKGNWVTKEGLQELNELISELKKEDTVTSVDSIFSTTNIGSPEQLFGALQQPETKDGIQPALNRFIQGSKALIPLHLSINPSSFEAQELVSKWSHKEWSHPLLFGGQVKFNQEIFDEIYQKVGLCLLIILGSTYLILMFAFRSIIIPLKAILMNIISLSSTFGILVWIFQGGHFGLPESDIALVLPVLVFSLVFGLSMDYEVFLISRIHEIYQETGDNTRSTIEGLASTSKIITSAALIMIVITGAFAFTGVMPVKQIGVGIAIAIFIDATIVRMILVPSLMKLLGDWNWWMPFTKKKEQELRTHKAS